MCLASFASLRRLAIVCVVAGSSLLVSATASAAVRVNTLTGTFKAEGVPGTGKVSLKVVVRNGDPVRVKNLVYKKLPARCNVSEVPLEPIYQPAGTLSGASVGSGKVEFAGLVNWFNYPGKGARQVILAGRLNSNGTKLTNGKLEVHNNSSGACQSAVGKFTAKR